MVVVVGRIREIVEFFFFFGQIVDKLCVDRE